MKRILGHIYFFYALSVFAITLFIVFIFTALLYWVKEPLRSHLLHPIFKAWMRIYMPLVFCRVYVKGKQHFNKNENFVIVCNHNSLADPPISTPFIPFANKTLAKIELSKIPIFGLVYKSGSILIDRKNEKSRKESVVQMQRVLDMGLNLCLYPEGTRNKTGKGIQPFFNGAFLTAIKAKKKIIPALIFNSKDLFPGKPSFWAWPQALYIDFLKPIATADISIDAVTELKDATYQIMSDYYATYEAARK
jgi:1-acyl-sn-glycerol-3-phosphate acyltransferase